MATLTSRLHVGRRAGQAMAEFAIVLPVLLIILIAVFDVGRLVFAYNDITNAARNGRSRRDRRPDGRQRPAIRAIQRRRPGPEEQPGPGHLPDSDLSATCPTPYKLGCVAKVAVSYDWKPITPMIGNILGPITVTTDTTLPIERIFP